ncbi:MAG: hypothetical protein NWR79_13475 [Saprospiraceae bacterium]|nr:hypothetical protein [Saprospiraceae bacterium]
MNPKSPLDELFRRKLSHYEVTPSDDLWDNIQLARAKKPSPRIPFWAPWLFTSLCLATLIYFSHDYLIPEQAKSTSLEEKPLQVHFTPKTGGEIPTPLPSGKTRAQSKKVAPIFKNSLPPQAAIIPTNDDIDQVTNTANITDQMEQTEQASESTFTSFPNIATLDATLPHELSMYSELLPVPFKKKLWFAKIDFLLSQDFVHSSLTSKTPLFDVYSTLRNNQEDLKVSNSFAVRMGISTLKGWGLRSGIQYSRMSQTLTLIIPDAPHQTTSKNTFETIDIPLILTKEQSFGKLRAGFSLGTYLNMAFNQKGSFYSPGGSLIEFTSSKPGSYPAFKNRLGASLYSGISLSIPIGNSLEFIAEPYVRSRIPAISAEDYVLEQKIWYGGLFIGFRKQIGKGFYLP